MLHLNYQKRNKEWDNLNSAKHSYKFENYLTFVVPTKIQQQKQKCSIYS